MRRVPLLVRLLGVGVGLSLVPAVVALTPAPIPAAMQAGPTKLAHRFQKIADGVYSAIGSGTMNVGANSAIVVNERDVLIVDSHITPASARVLLQEIKTITDKPVRYVVNTHYHFDHAHGNQIFPDDVEVVGHEFTRQMLLSDVLNQPTYKSFTAPVPGRIDELKKLIPAETDPTKNAQLRNELTVQQDYWEALKEVRPTPPNVTLRTRMTLYRGGREIQLHFFGRGHTGGDVVVFLPKERIVATGDLLTAGLSYMGDAHVDEWATTLETLKSLDFEWVIPGHGEPYAGKARLEHFQSYLRDAWKQVSALKAQRVPPEDAAKRVDMTAHQANFPQIQGSGIDLRAVQRMYDVMDTKR